jgi:hypothetical protein
VSGVRPKRSSGAEALAVQSDGKLVVVGRSLSNLIVARGLPEGSLDGAFGTGGSVIDEAASGATDVPLAGGKILVGLPATTSSPSSATPPQAVAGAEQST